MFYHENTHDDKHFISHVKQHGSLTLLVPSILYVIYISSNM